MNNFLQTIINLLGGLLGSKKSPPPATPKSVGATDSLGQPEAVAPRVLLIVVDPIVDTATGETLT